MSSPTPTGTRSIATSAGQSLVRTTHTSLETFTVHRSTSPSGGEPVLCAITGTRLARGRGGDWCAVRGWAVISLHAHSRHRILLHSTEDRRRHERGQALLACGGQRPLFGEQCRDTSLLRHHALGLRQEHGAMAQWRLLLLLLTWRSSPSTRSRACHVLPIACVTPLKPLFAVLDSSSFSTLPGYMGSGQSSVDAASDG